MLPPGVAGSVTHKNDLAIAMIARGSPGLGIDLEDTDRDRPGVASRVLRTLNGHTAPDPDAAGAPMPSGEGHPGGHYMH